VFVEGGDGMVVDGSRGVRVSNARLKVRSVAVLVRAGAGVAGGARGGGGVPTESVRFSEIAIIAALVAFKVQVQSGGSARGVLFVRARQGGGVGASVSRAHLSSVYTRRLWSPVCSYP